jgi:hypothetical protein
VLYGLAQVSAHHGFGHPAVLVPLIAGLAVLAAFVVRTVRARGKVQPVIDLGLFRNCSFTGAASLMFVAGLSMYGALLLLPLYYQQVRGAGLATATIAVMAGAFTGLALAQVPHASSATRILQQVGGSFGTAVLTVILELQLTGRTTGTGTGLAAAFDRTFWWAIAFTVAGALLALLLRRPAPPPAEPPRE